MCFTTQDLLDQQNGARNDRRMADQRHQTGMFEDTTTYDNGGGRARVIFKDQSNFQPSMVISMTHSTTQFKKWLDEVKAYFDISHA